MSTGESISRRDLLLGKVFRAPAREPADSPVQASPKSEKLLTILRPPGAVDERAFLAGCTKCNECANACPVEAIFSAPPRFGSAAGTPMIDPMQAPCVMCEDTPCIAACEPNVLQAELGLRMGTAKIKQPHCLAFNGTICTVCSERCPVEGALALDQGRPVINEQACTGCGVCQYVCPAPYNAIAILPVASRYEESGEESAAVDSQGRNWRQEYFGNRSLKPEANVDPSPHQNARD